MKKRIVTLLTDFGTKDGYTGCLKGVLKSHYPEVDIIDISHDIDPFDIKEAAFSLHNYYSYFPKGTIHIAVVDPGVGSERRPLLIRTAQHFFIGPDNGIFRFIFNREAYTAFELDADEINTNKESQTFHGRDLFAPTAGKILNGLTCEQLGKRLDQRTEIPNLFFSKGPNNTLVLEAVATDRFGNIITGFSRRDLERMKKHKVDNIKVKDFSTSIINTYYAEKKEGELLALWNSMGFLEIAVANGNATKKLNFNKKKDSVVIKIS
jgi:S-adenosylmethionine hydrolase